MVVLNDMEMERLAPFLAAGTVLDFEHSVKLTQDGVRPREKLVLWLRFGRDGLCSEAALDALLRSRSCPDDARAAIQAQSGRILNLGLVTNRKGQTLPLVYVHRISAQGRDSYRAFSWKEGTPGVRLAEYVNHFLPETPQGLRPETMLNGENRRLFAALAAHPKAVALSNFWLRHKGGTLDQVCLCVPWMPDIGAFPNQFLRAFPNLPALLCGPLKSCPIRHVAFDPKDKQAAATLYFSGPIDLPERFDCAAMIAQSARNATAARAAIAPALTDAEPASSKMAQGPDIGAFYGSQNVAVWTHILGAPMHYHHGQFLPDEDPIDCGVRPFERSVEDMARHVPEGASVYDMGCGWGGPAQWLTTHKSAALLAATNSRVQYRHCTDLCLRTRLTDLEHSLPPGIFDIGWMMESFEHIRDKARFLRRIRPFVNRLVARVNCQDQSPESVNFGNTMWMISSERLKAELENAGWRIVAWQNRREGTAPSAEYWQNRLTKVPLTSDAHIETLRSFCDRVVPMAEAWARNNPLIEFVAEPDGSSTIM